jgi:hypothetical protein
MPVWPRVRSATAGLSEPAQHGGGPFYESVVPGRPSAITVRRSRGSSGWVPGGADLPGPRCCQMRTLSKSARSRPRQCASIMPPDLWAAERR